MFEGERKGRERKRKKDSGIFTIKKSIYIHRRGREEARVKGKRKEEKKSVDYYSFSVHL